MTKKTKIVPATLIVDGKEVSVIHAVTGKQMKRVIQIDEEDE